MQSLLFLLHHRHFSKDFSFAQERFGDFFATITNAANFDLAFGDEIQLICMLIRQINVIILAKFFLA